MRSKITVRSLGEGKPSQSALSCQTSETWETVSVYLAELPTSPPSPGGQDGRNLNLLELTPQGSRLWGCLPSLGTFSVGGTPVLAGTASQEPLPHSPGLSYITGSSPSPLPLLLCLFLFLPLPLTCSLKLAFGTQGQTDCSFSSMNMPFSY
jgi:hypothetical protein